MFPALLAPLAASVKIFSAARGRVAQLGERLVRNEEAGGSNPLSSTRFQRTYIIFENRVVFVLPANERAGKSK